MITKTSDSKMFRALLVVLSSFSLSSASADAPNAARPIPNSFEECVAESGKILKMYPPKCVTRDGEVFVQQRKKEDKHCSDKCGDGECQEIVCMALGCPCPESRATCPKDCSE